MSRSCTGRSNHEFLAYVATLETTEGLRELDLIYFGSHDPGIEDRVCSSGIADATDEMALLEERDLLFARYCNTEHSNKRQI